MYRSNLRGATTTTGVAVKVDKWLLDERGQHVVTNGALLLSVVLLYPSVADSGRILCRLDSRNASIVASKVACVFV